jgi:hypothetical protein
LITPASSSPPARLATGVLLWPFAFQSADGDGGDDDTGGGGGEFDDSANEPLRELVLSKATPFKATAEVEIARVGATTASLQWELPFAEGASLPVTRSVLKVYDVTQSDDTDEPCKQLKCVTSPASITACAQTLAAATVWVRACVRACLRVSADDDGANAPLRSRLLPPPPRSMCCSSRCFLPTRRLPACPPARAPARGRGRGGG